MITRSIFRIVTVASLCAVMFAAPAVIQAASHSSLASSATMYGDVGEDEAMSAPQTSRTPQQIDAYDGPETRGPVAVAATLSRYSIPGTALQPTDSTNAYSYGSNGCLINQGGAQSYDTPVILPDGAQLETLRIYWQNNGITSTATSTAYLMAFTRTAVTTEGIVSVKMGNKTLETVNTTSAVAQGSGHWTRFVDNSAAHVVDNVANAYVVRWSAPASDRVELCAIRIGYYAPVFYSTYMPVVIK